MANPRPLGHAQPYTSSKEVSQHHKLLTLVCDLYTLLYVFKYFMCNSMWPRQAKCLDTHALMGRPTVMTIQTGNADFYVAIANSHFSSLLLVFLAIWHL